MTEAQLVTALRSNPVHLLPALRQVRVASAWADGARLIEWDGTLLDQGEAVPSHPDLAILVVVEGTEDDGYTHDLDPSGETYATRGAAERAADELLRAQSPTWVLP